MKMDLFLLSPRMPNRAPHNHFQLQESGSSRLIDPSLAKEQCSHISSTVASHSSGVRRLRTTTRPYFSEEDENWKKHCCWYQRKRLFFLFRCIQKIGWILHHRRELVREYSYIQCWKLKVNIEFLLLADVWYLSSTMKSFFSGVGYSTTTVDFFSSSSLSLLFPQPMIM